MRPAERIMEREEYARQFPVHVGVDAGKSFHKLVACGPDGVRTKAERVEVSRAGFEGALRFLQETFPDRAPAQMLVAIEFAGHYGYTFAEFLRQAGCVIVTMPSVVTKRLREVEDNSPRKDDAKDAAQICKLVRAGLFVNYATLTPLVAQLRVLATERHRLAVEETRMRIRLQAILDLAWPEFMTHFPHVGARTPRALLRRWPTATDVAAASPRAVVTLMKRVSQNHFKPDRAKAFVAAAETSVAIHRDVPARRAEIHRLLDRWDLLLTQMETIEAELSVLVAQHPGATALTTIPEVGVVCAATLVAEVGTPEGFASPRQVLKLAGMNLARRESGTSLRSRAKQTKRGRPLLRRQLFLLAGRWCRTGAPYHRAFLAMAARNGGSKISAICALSRRLVPMLLHVMQTGEAFDQRRWDGARVDPMLLPEQAA
ncbi:MAG: IS110 family transposase [Gemmatimonadaceae bacterium]